MAHSSMAVDATMEADLGEENSRAVSPNTQPGFLWILILPPSTYMIKLLAESLTFVQQGQVKQSQYS